jgi:hypothetical protein
MVHRLVMLRFLIPGLCALGLVASPAAAFQAEVARYHQVVATVCVTGITPEIVAAYERARQAVDQARHGSGRDGNFWGVKSPEGFRQDCFQSDGKI